MLTNTQQRNRTSSASFEDLSASITLAGQFTYQNIYTSMKTFSEYNHDEDQVHIPGYGVMRRVTARKEAIKRFTDIVERMQTGQIVTKGMIDLARDHYLAAESEKAYIPHVQQLEPAV